MRIVLDTNVFWDKAALAHLIASDHEVVVPAVAFTERARQLHDAGVAPEAFKELLGRMEFRVEPYTHAEAARYAARVRGRDAWRRLARDAMIAGHVCDGDVLWTHNRRDFLAVGVPEGQVKTP